MNKVIIVGRLVKDSEIRYSGNTAVAHFTLAVDRQYKTDGEKNADFIRCVSFNKLAEFFDKYGQKGVKFLIEGRWQTGNYKDKDGNWVNTNECVVERAEFSESKSTQPQEQKPNPAPVNLADAGFMTIPDGIDEELPFM